MEPGPDEEQGQQTIMKTEYSLKYSKTNLKKKKTKKKINNTHL